MDAVSGECQHKHKELIKQLQDEFERSGQVEIATFQITGVNGNQNFICLRGTAKSFYQKQLAQ